MALHHLGRMGRSPSPEPVDVLVSVFVDRPTYARLDAYLERAGLDVSDDARDDLDRQERDARRRARRKGPPAS